MRLLYIKTRPGVVTSFDSGHGFIPVFIYNGLPQAIYHVELIFYYEALPSILKESFIDVRPKGEMGE